MLNIDTNEQIETLYKLIQIKGGKRVEKFQSTDINRALEYHKHHVNRYKEGLLMEILPIKKSYDWKEKKINYKFE